MGTKNGEINEIQYIWVNFNKVIANPGRKIANKLTYCMKWILEKAKLNVYLCPLCDSVVKTECQGKCKSVLNIV